MCFTLQAIKFTLILDAVLPLSAYGGLLATVSYMSGAQPMLLPQRLEGLPCHRLLQLFTAVAGPRGAKHVPVPIPLPLQAADTCEPTKVCSATTYCCQGQSQLVAPAF